VGKEKREKKGRGEEIDVRIGSLLIDLLPWPRACDEPSKKEEKRGKGRERSEMWHLVRMI